MRGALHKLLRPCLHKYDLQPTGSRAHQAYARLSMAAGRRRLVTNAAVGGGHDLEVQRRTIELRGSGLQIYPRIDTHQDSCTCAEFCANYQSLKPSETAKGGTVTVRGRIRSTRVAGSKLVFLDVVQEEERVQGLCNLRTLQEYGVTSEQFQLFYKIARKGDIYSITGTPHRTARGELSILATKLPELLTPSLRQLPHQLQDIKVRMRNRHTDLLVNRRTADTLRMRSHIVQGIREFLLQQDFYEVETPILADSAGGAIARPFKTVATEIPNKKLALRIAPELWLKRLIIGGFDRVFEIGPQFRNEGLDRTHNAEFTTCEFYQAFANIDDLIRMSESLLRFLSKRVEHVQKTKLISLPQLDIVIPPGSFDQKDFITVLEHAIGREIPDLSTENAVPKLVQLFDDLDLAVPEKITLPRLLDRLSTTFLEPQCIAPTFIMNPPECLAPLAKSFPHPTYAHQRVSARVELFIQGREILNAYEEENSPFEQRRKLEAQLVYNQHDRDSTSQATLDESYLEALEWGLPPTGGWGCGIDRLVMLFTGASKISDVLTFGNLRNVVALGTPLPSGPGSTSS